MSNQCQCQNGFTFASASADSDAPETCVDIDECRSSHICSEQAQCYNRLGGYDCVCNPGYEGTGFDCHRISPRFDATTPYYGPATCEECSENADCQEGVCVCQPGFIGNGQDCKMICALNELFDGASCVKLASVEDGKNWVISNVVPMNRDE